MDKREVGAVFSKIVIVPVRNRIAPITAAGGTCLGALKTVFSSRATVPTVLRRLGERDCAHQVVSERIPQRHRFYLVEPAHQKLGKSAPARDGINTLGGGGALLVNLLGRVTAHALAPL